MARPRTDGAVHALVDAVLAARGPPVLAFAEVRHAGGAIARVDVTSSA